LGRSLSAGRSPGSKRFLGHENPLKMHTLSINFISFTAKMHCICYAKKATLASWGPWPLCPPPLNPPMCACHRIRALFGKDILLNAIHGPSNRTSAENQIKLIFGDVEFDEEGLAHCMSFFFSVSCLSLTSQNLIYLASYR